MGSSAGNFDHDVSLGVQQRVAPFVVTGGLGQGGYACVVKARHTESNGEFALKVVSKKVGARIKDRKRLALELRIMSELPANPYLIRCHAAFESASDIYFVLDLFTGGDLFYHLAKHQETSKVSSVIIIVNSLFLILLDCACI